MVNKKKQNRQKSFEESIIKDDPGSFKFYIKYYIINYIGLIIVFPLADLIICLFSHKEFHYNAISHLGSPAIWALFFLIFEIIWLKSSKKNNKK